MRLAFALACVVALAACNKFDHLGKPPSFTPSRASNEHHAMVFAGMPAVPKPQTGVTRASLWSRDQASLLGDRRAAEKGDILTVVIEIDESAEISNSTARSRSSNGSMQIPEFFGIPQRIDKGISEGASMANAVSTSSASGSNGDGSVRRNEKLMLKVAATVVDELPNGVLAIEGAQEVRVNFELRELLVTGFVRPADISRKNEITYDKIAAARISYGGRGQITDVQQPRYGQQVMDTLLPF
ncbi:flagellar basal body L-ring protein FlgH [Pseudoprimorskyibacter insulae]|uniref:Flagellar L-ring protein n=1 Tax=Pseudoprimorskyibacter insulae TaxID=1695997 RepID=A0A2R8AYW2_9RHOB|nr:flagellar basal body L-ring protein FlgH [Pseudoprimorskyibacter insulae]SPF81218.1 Flagellar L-ring protein [Pseudoprimorskyibacter insulae]